MPDLTWGFLLLLFATGLLAGVANAIAGGGTFFTFPAFIAAGVPPVAASASNAFAVWPGHAFAVVGYRRELSGRSASVRGSVVVALLGGVTGAALLATVGNKAFAQLIPFLILFATVLFALGPALNRWLRARAIHADYGTPKPLTRALEFAFAVYGGFFGAGLGIMMMAGLQLLGVMDVQLNNALKNLLAAIVNTVAVIVLAFSGLISWPHTLVAFAGAVVGGLAGGRLARTIPAAWLRRVVIAVGLGLSVYYFDAYFLAQRP
jgi:uncharacterized membrane protein YfcA